ncbi:hypothetical protein BMR04_12435 [Methylococcaceae bacterium HT3]|nr:hypothetical protein BMR04_12435 [Methylococcaceae bacterium HT3]
MQKEKTMVLDAFYLIPIVVGDCPAEQIEQLLELFFFHLSDNRQFVETVIKLTLCDYLIFGNKKKKMFSVL